ncbi:hypothetical protein ZWY2020_026526 [Hordeum vulgare]|nr:hypothetical protein ZWY2020_026526 [Hordeum vulgare]
MGVGARVEVSEGVELTVSGSGYLIFQWAAAEREAGRRLSAFQIDGGSVDGRAPRPRVVAWPEAALRCPSVGEGSGLRLRATELAHARAGSRRRARLTTAAAALAACKPTEAPVAAALEAAFPEAPSEKDAAIMLNTAAGNPATTMLALRWFLENAEVRSKASTVLSQYFAALLPAQSRRWDAMLRDGVQPDNTTFSTVISCACACGPPGKAVEWFEKMPETGCSPDMLLYSVLIDTYDRAGDAEMALRSYDHARSERCQLDPVICATVIKVHSTNSNFDDALNVFEEMKVVGVKPTLVVYNTVLDAMGRAMRLWVVKTIHREMVSQKVQPNRATYCSSRTAASAEWLSLRADDSKP